MADSTTEDAIQSALRHHKAGRLQQAGEIYRRILARDPDHVVANHYLGVIAHQLGRSEIALELIRRAIALNPGYAEAHNNLGNALKDSGQIEEAIASFRRALALNPSSAAAHVNLGNVLKDTGLIDEAIAAYRAALVLQPDFAEAHSNVVYTLYVHPACDAWAIAREHREWNRIHAEPLKPLIKPHLNDPRLDRRLRVGYVSPDFRQHPIGRFLLPLLENHDRGRFEVFAYANNPISDAMTGRLRAHTDAWRGIEGLTSAQAADLIREDRIDILVDLSLHMAHNRLLMFALKPAPVQVTYLAYAGSSGLSTMDYRLSDPWLDPPEDAQSFGPGGGDSIYSEETIRLPETYWCYQPVAEVPILAPPMLATGFITFGCLNNFCKVNEPLLSLWTQIIAAVPRSRLALFAPQGAHRGWVSAYLQREGVQSRRVSFLARAPTTAYLESYHSIDIALDTAPYGGGTTTCDALWMGVPVVSLAGKTAVGRGGLSILSNIGLPDLVARTPEEYVRIAASLANDLTRLTLLRSTLRQRMEASPLMDAPKFAGNVEAAYREMWRAWCESQAQR